MVAVALRSNVVDCYESVRWGDIQMVVGCEISLFNHEFGKLRCCDIHDNLDRILIIGAVESASRLLFFSTRVENRQAMMTFDGTSYFTIHTLNGAILARAPPLSCLKHLFSFPLSISLSMDFCIKEKLQQPFHLDGEK